MDNIYEIFEKVGLTKQESRVYLALLELQESQTGRLCKFTHIASSNIYHLLDSLIEKGLISYRVQNNIKIFMPSPPEAINELFLEKRRQLEKEQEKIAETVSNLKKREIKKEPQSNYKYYEGITGIKSMWHEINEKMNPENASKVYTAKKESYEKFIGFYDEHHKLRKKKKVHEKMIFPIEDNKLAKKREDKFTKIKFMELKNDAEWGILGDRFFIQYITTKAPRGFIIKDETFAKTMEQVFDELWKTARP